MPPIESFLTNLLEMRADYQVQIQQCNLLAAPAQEGLGARQERWQGVPGKLGVYKLDLEKH